ncbi:bifunctional pyr operon transcriptional regulator/uracil phosphoribosyltransferase PyrR [Ferruginibacter sp. SUN002]|uniref:bifunctional pyr operon transcriptional regulator/uracil phosphoribosyltransferase PyrR n=1 Tax=Ferruginibacter sp. SUN002 TaxID=2937789 RepID=UPI003D3666F7
MKEILSHSAFKTQVENLADAIVKQHKDISNVVFVGIQQGGVLLADDIISTVQNKLSIPSINYGQLDITFYRDDIRNEILAPDVMHIPFSIENKIVILIDDVLFTGRTIKAALDALIDLGRPEKIELCVLIDRKEHRQFPIQADFAGVEVKTEKTDKIKLQKDNNGNKNVVLIN